MSASVIRRAVAAVIVLAVTAACSSTSTLTENERVAMQQLESLPDWTDELTREQRTCIDGEFRGLGLTDPRIFLDPTATAEQTQAMNVFLECVPAIYEVDGWVRLNATAFEGMIPGDITLPLEEGRCLLRTIVEGSDDPARTLVTSDRPEDVILVEDAVFECFSDDTFSAFEDAQPRDYGDDPTFDMLHDECLAGDDEACDLLYVLSLDDGDYAVVAFDCGGRQPDIVDACTQDIAFDDQGWLLPDSPGTERLQDECMEGNFTACDLLYELSEPASAAEQLGWTCGERIPLRTQPTCRDVFG